jgi:hypothetical protein
LLVATSPAQWKDALAQLDRLSVPTETGENRIKARTPGENQGTYMDDPAGYVIQYITEGMQQRL